MLNIEKPQDFVVEKITSLIYGSPGTGKTSLAFTSEKPLLLDCGQAGSHRAIMRGDTAFIKDYSEVQNISKNAQQLSHYKTIIIDDVGSLLDLMTYNIIKSGKRGVAYNGVLSQQGWGELKLYFQAFYTELKKLDKDIVFIAHEREKEVEGEKPLIRPDISGSAGSLLRKYADVIGFIEVKSKKTVISFSPHERIVAKNCANLGEFEIPNHKNEAFIGIYAKITQKIKDTLNSQSEVFALYSSYRERIIEANSISEIQELSKSIAGMQDLTTKEKVKVLFVSRIRELGIKYNAETKAYEFLRQEEPTIIPQPPILSKQDTPTNDSLEAEIQLKKMLGNKVAEYQKRIAECKKMGDFQAIFDDYKSITAPTVKKAVEDVIYNAMILKGIVEQEDGKLVKKQVA